jgi:hypothetical protein
MRFYLRKNYTRSEKNAMNLLLRTFTFASACIHAPAPPIFHTHARRIIMYGAQDFVAAPDL